MAKVVGVPAHPSLRDRLNPSNFFSGGQVELFVHHSAADHAFLIWLRLPNVLLGAFTILLTYFAVRRMTNDRWSPVVAAAFAAFLPHFVFLSSTVTNDNLVTLLGALLTYLAVRWIHAPSGWGMAGIGVTIGLLLTTKVSTLPIVLIIVVLAWVSGGRRERVKNVAIGAGTALLVSSPFLLQNTARYGSPLARAAASSYLTKIGGLGVLGGKPYVVHDPIRLILIQVPQRIMETFWYPSGWKSWPIDLAITLVFVVALAGLIGRRHDTRVIVALASVAVAGLVSVWLVAFVGSGYRASYAFIGLTAFASLFALAVERWKPLVRFVLPAAGLVGTAVAIQTNVLAVRWT